MPTPKKGEVLIKVHAASVNSWDWDLLRGKPKIYRLLFGLFKPRNPIIGSDVAGTIEGTGADVTDFQLGDAVFGDISGSGFGAFAEYVCAPARLLAKKPKAISFEQAAAMPQAGLLALQGLRQGHIEKAQTVLINGAGGGAGTFAIQMAKWWGAEVTAVDHGNKFDLMTSLGADHLLDYTKEDFTKSGITYDLILDMVSNHGISDYKRVLSPQGSAIIVGGIPSKLISFGLFGWWIAKPKTVAIMPQKLNRQDLETLAEMLRREQIKPVIDKIYPLEEIAQAIQYLGEGLVKGKVIIRIV